MKPSVGRIVHYVARGSADGRFPPACRAATITEVSTDSSQMKRSRVGLAVLNPTGVFFHPVEGWGGCALDEGHEPAVNSNERGLCDGLHHEGGTWHWPAQV